MEWLSCVGNWVNRGFTWPKVISHMMSKCQNGCIAFLLAELDKVQNHNSHICELCQEYLSWLHTGVCLVLMVIWYVTKPVLENFVKTGIFCEKGMWMPLKTTKQSCIQIRNFSLCHFCPCHKILLQSVDMGYGDVVDVANKQRRNQKQKYKQTAIKTLPYRYWRW